jgi:hypothetical protein
LLRPCALAPPSRFFFDSTRCKGSLRVDDSCQPCTPKGECPAGNYFRLANCDGSGTVDTTCVACTVSGSCPVGKYFTCVRACVPALF